MNLVDLINKINISEEVNYDEIEGNRELHSLIWNYVLNKSTDEEIKLINLINENKLKDLVEFIKSENELYFKLDILRENKNIDLAYIYSKSIVVNQVEQLEKELKIKKKDLYGIIDVLFDVNIYCIRNNKSGNELVSILIEEYDITPSIAYPLQSIYEQNKLSLKLDYIILSLQK